MVGNMMLCLVGGYKGCKLIVVELVFELMRGLSSNYCSNNWMIFRYDVGRLKIKLNCILMKICNFLLLYLNLFILV